MKKDMGSCFLCELPLKGKRFKFYSGLLKGGSTTRLMTYTVTVFERWSELTEYEISVCRHCQQRLWRNKHLLPMVLCGGALAITAVFALAALVLLPGIMRFAVPCLTALIGLVLTGAFLYFLWQLLAGKPTHAQLEPLVIGEAMGKLPRRNHTFLTTDQFIERHEKGMI